MAHSKQFNIESSIPSWSSESGPRDEIESEFAESFESQTQAQRDSGRVAVIEFPVDDNHKPYDGRDTAQIFSGPGGWESLERWIPKSGLNSSSYKFRGLIILEDLGANYVSVLANLLRIPMSVFSNHWTLPDNHTLGRARVPLGQDARYHFVLNYVQEHSIIIPNKNKDYTYRLACNAYRTIDFNVRSDTNREHDKQTSEQLITYWGAELEDHGVGSWIALLLVDPPLKKNDLLHSIYIAEHPKVIVNCFMGDTAAQPLQQLSSIRLSGINSKHEKHEKHRDIAWRSTNGVKRPRAVGNCMFVDLIKGHGQFSSEEPISATWRCQRLILARASTRLQVAFSDAISRSVASSAGVEEMSSFNYDTFDKAAWNSTWEGKQFTRLWEQRENLELLRYKLRQNIQTIRRVAPKVIPSGLRTYAIAIAEQQENDLVEWTDLEAMAEYINQVIVRTTDSYLQTVAAREATVSNFQARSVNQLTRMATIFVPVSLCAAIFSMGGNFAAGDKLFWIFWAVSMPIAIGLIILMFTRVGTGLSNAIDTGRKQVADFKQRIRARRTVDRNALLEMGTSKEVEIKSFTGGDRSKTPVRPTTPPRRKTSLGLQPRAMVQSPEKSTLSVPPLTSPMVQQLPADISHSSPIPRDVASRAASSQPGTSASVAAVESISAHTKPQPFVGSLSPEAAMIPLPPSRTSSPFDSGKLKSGESSLRERTSLQR